MWCRSGREEMQDPKDEDRDKGRMDDTLRHPRSKGPGRGPEPTDEELIELARACWKETEPMTYEEDAARAAVAAAIDFAADADSQHFAARRAFEKFLESGNRLLPHADPFTTRLHWTIWLMAQRLFETSLYDGARRCIG